MKHTASRRFRQCLAALPKRNVLSAFAALLPALQVCWAGDDRSGAAGFLLDAAATVASPADASSSSSAIDCGTSDLQSEALRLINARRAAGASCGARGTFASSPALRWNATLASAAHAHARDMAENDFASHTGTDGSTIDTRITAAGYAWRAVAENIAGGQPSVQSVIAVWMASPGHCANLMDASLRDAGLACARNAESRYGIYWTLDLARPR